ncbi:MAG: gamma-glutamyltranspeptidase / glutathione hydrolase [Solirubrobacteraceae bacterium]|nr:gamma-glutamyltranspeptidase / glutathione hydrolase [Solirubrobacteraceae bacterium]
MGQGPNSHRGVIAAGHARTAEVGADVLRAGGNAVDAAVAAVAASFTAEPLLTGLGAGGYMLVTSPSGAATLLDFFVEAPGRGADSNQRAELVPVSVSFGDAVQIFNVGPASVGAYGMPHGLCAAVERFGSLPLSELLEPAARLARDGVVLTAEQAYVIEILAGIATSTPECAALFAPGGQLLREGDVFSNPELGDTLERLGREGADPFYRGDIATAIVDYLAPRGSMLTREDLAAYEVVARTPLRASYRGRDVLLNPPPSAGGVLIAFALSLLGRTPGPPTIEQTVEVMNAAQAERTPEFLAGLAEEGFLERFLSTRMGSTTHISVLDVDGLACSVTSSNGEGCGIVVPGTGLHINNMMGEEDLNPLGFHRHPPGRRLPSMMAPTIVLADERPELVLGSGGSNRIRSAILQTIVNVLDRGMSADEAVRAPRAHFEDGIVYAEPGIDTQGIEGQDRAIARFRDLNLFFGGVHAVERDPGTGALSGGGDPRRGGASVVA